MPFMKKIKKTFKALAAILKNPWLLNRVLSDDKIWEEYLEKKYHLKQLPLVDIGEFISDSSEILEVAFLDGSSLPTDLALLKALSKKFQHCKYFEIGTWRGESAANVSDVSAECYTLNLSVQEMLQRGYTRKHTEQLGYFSKEKNNITHLYGNSLGFDFHSLNKKFDLIFIDGDHHYDYVKNDTEKIFQHLTHESTTVIWHDYAYHPEKVRPEVLAAILDGMPPAFHHSLYHVSNTMCAIFTKEKLKTETLQVPVMPKNKFRIKIESILMLNEFAKSHDISNPDSDKN